MKKTLMLVFAVPLLSAICFSQSVEISKTNKTIAVRADDSASIEPDVAIVSFGYENYGTTKDEAYRENLKVSDAIVKAMLDSGVPKTVIETGTIKLVRIEPEDNWTPEQKKQRQFEANQSWSVKIPSLQAEKLVAIVMQAGANKLQGVSWDFSDRPSLQAKASGAALAKARQIAEQMAKGLGAKLGELVYASNEAPEVTSMPIWRSTASNIMLTKNWARSNASNSADFSYSAVSLFPQKITQSATVYAVFAIE